MISFFTRLQFAFRTFLSIVSRGQIPGDIAAALAEPSQPAPHTREAQSADVKREPTATQVLAVLQRDGRLIDFLMEDITSYADAQIGAAVRDVHAGCRQSLLRYLALGPVLDRDEGSRITLDAGTDAARIKVIGNVAGQPPFQGVLRHRGWLVSRIDLPSLPSTGRSVVAPAEVEVVEVA